MCFLWLEGGERALAQQQSGWNSGRALQQLLQTTKPKANQKKISAEQQQNTA